ncbi:terephthalate 1,2-dioxygenase [Bradyrhizobium sp. CSA207]|uniref:aromatic-ring-hydroxylating dioxygenase subunit beta n=1 Tax=Bradyrhizobium sp. CSA207 TaxID=2698826 RepID=UPI0023AEFED8|nr:nuclear transport factor 2 family protein [Bradyrhizobium sp. CSA207]MDE5445816.1 terephthalate 1,2-dioxygenase [Bradyrhizobium sp. CSA207]
MSSVIEKRVTPSSDDQYREAAELIAAYGHAMDDGKIDLWPQFFTPSGVYHITTKENQDAGLPIGIMRCVGRGMMIDRVKAFHTANIFEPHSYNHVVGHPTMSYDKATGCVMARSNFQVVRIMESGRMDLFAAGKYLDVIQREGGSLKFRERVVVLDSRNVDILLVVPL